MFQEKINNIHSLKNKFPFRLGTTSYIIPGEILPNVITLADLVDDVELVLFEVDETSNLPDKNVIDQLIQLKNQHDLSYTVHFPLDILLGSTNENIRRGSVEKCLRVFYLVESIQPFAYVLHLTGNPSLTGGKTNESIEDWLSSIKRSCQEIIEAGIRPDQLCAETLNYPFRAVESIVSDFGLSICLDAGHVLLNKFCLKDYLHRYIDNTRIVHLHGIRGSIDHKSIMFLDDNVLADLIALLVKRRSKTRVVTLEIFSENDLVTSFEKLARYLPWEKYI